MKYALFLSAVLFFSNGSNDVYYYYKDVKCSYSFTTTNEYQLTLSDQHIFKLNIKMFDTRYRKNSKQEFSGIFEYKIDTLVLKFSNNNLKTYNSKVINYLLRGDSLIIEKQSFSLPKVFNKVMFFPSR